MRIEIEQHNRTLYVRLLDPRLEGENEIVDALKEYVEVDLERVEIDFGQVEYMNSRGITELVSIYRSFDADKTKLKFLNVRGRVRHVMDLVELHHIAEIQGE
ncbi:MAG: STAS domain-containing protein [bacterium]|nr:STAS domain-containing protein [bacterium]